MASLCKRQQCTIERRGFRQELDSWRYKLIHCVGFESILEGLFGQELVEDLALFKDCEPEVVSDWSYDENCLFCCLRREKVKEHLTGLNDQVLEEGEKALCKQEQSKINRLEKQAEEFLNAVFYRKEIPSFSDPHIPLVAREIMQRMIRQFAAEYTSKTSSSQDSLQPNGTKDQSLPKAPSLAAAPAASAQNPVLSKLLMEDQDSPLDLTVKKPEAQPSEQDGVLDLSTKKSLTSSSTSLRNSHGSPPMSIKGDSLDRSLAKVRDLQSTSTLQQFMAKLCRHHQRQIVDALGYLQTEVKAVADSCCPPQTDCSPLPQQKNTDFLCTGKRAAAATASTRTMNASLEVANLPNFIITVPQHPPECAGATGMAGEVRLTRSDPLDLRKVAPGYSRGSSFLFSSAGGERENKLQEDLLPLTEKNKSSTSQPEVKKSHMLESSSCTLVGTLHERQCNPETLLHPSRSDLSLEELSPSVRAHDHLYHTEQRVSSGRTKDLLVRSYPNKKASKTSPVSPRTARKSTRGPLPQHRDPVPQIINDPDIHCDIVYISKPITESELQSPNHISPRRNARKSTRGHAYIKECCELKTVRTLAGKSSPSDKGNCPAPVLETSTSVTPKHPLSKPDSVPPVDISFAGGCGETFVQKATLDQLMEKEIAADDVTLIGEADLIVQTSQTGKQPFITQTSATPEILSSLVSQQITEEEGRQQRHQEEGEESQSEEAYAPCFPKEVAQEDGNEEDACSDQPHVEGTGTVQPEDDLSNLAVAGSKEAESLIVSVDEPQTCASEPQSSPRLASPMLSTEDSIRSESMSAIIECEKQSQILELPMAEDLELSKDQEPSVHLAKETLAENEEQVEKDNFEEQKTNCTSSVSRETDDNVQEETRTDAVGGKAEVAVGKELSSVIDLPSEHCEVEGSKMEAAVTSSEIIAPKKGSSRDIAPSDRCLRRRIPLNTSETTNVSKTTEETPPLPQNQGSPVDDLKNSGSVRSNRSIRLRQPGVSTSLSHTVPQTTEEPVDKTQLSHEGKSNLGQVLDSMVQTRHKAMLAKQLESDGRNQGSKAASTSTAGSSTETDRLKVPSKLTQPKEKQAAPSVEEKIPGDSSASVENTLDKCRKMPLRRDRASSGLSTKPMSSATLMKHKKVVLRSQRSATLLAAGKKEEVEQNYADCSIKARAEKSPQLQKRDLDPFGLQKLDLSAPNPPKFLEALRGEENQLQITSLNTRYDRMQRGWVQLDKEGQPAPRPKNKADRLKEIWKSKRRVRKPRPLDQQKYSPVQMLFMKTFDLTSICRWFLQTTETKSLVIVKKVNTRLPSETQLCFHSSSGAQGSSHGVFPSLQAERLKKHLKKFAVASPVKSNAKNQKLIAKAWEQDGPCSKGKEKVKELTSATRISTKPYSHPHKLQTQAIENPKAVSAVKSPASARILRKYTNIREKLQVQQHALKTKETSAEDLKSSSVKPLISPKLMSKPKASLEQGKKTAPAGKTSGKEPHQSKNVKVNSLSSSKRDAFKKVVKEKGTKRSGSSKSLTSLSKKDHKALKRVPPSAPRPRKASASSSVASRLKERPVVTNRTSKATGVQKAGLVKDASQKSGGLNVQMKMPLRSKVVEHAAVHQQSPETLPSPSQDQVLTRSQRKMEAMPSTSGGSKRTQEITLPPAKRTRTSLLK